MSTCTSKITSKCVTPTWLSLAVTDRANNSTCSNEEAEGV